MIINIIPTIYRLEVDCFDLFFTYQIIETLIQESILYFTRKFIETLNEENYWNYTL